jgi:hypothetical protein
MPNPLLLVIVDESGSMGNQHQSVVDGINQTITDQKKFQEGKEYDFSLWKFNEIPKEIRCCKLADAENITNDDYKPFSRTAMYDAIGLAMDKYRDRDDVIIVIVTDGKDNSSKRYGKKDINSLIKESTQAGWKFIYLSEDPTVTQEVASTGMSNLNASISNYEVDRCQSGRILKSQNLQTYIRTVSNRGTDLAYGEWEKKVDAGEIQIDL